MKTINILEGIDRDILEDHCARWEKNFRKHNNTYGWKFYVSVKKQLGQYDTMDAEIRQTLSAMALLEANSKEPA